MRRKRTIKFLTREAEPAKFAVAQSTKSTDGSVIVSLGNKPFRLKLSRGCCFPFMLDTKFNTGARSRRSRYGIKSSLVRKICRIQVAPSRTRQGCPPLYRPTFPQSEGDQDSMLSGITTKRVIEIVTNRPQAGVCGVYD